jgi:hypothetical protein
MSSVSFSRLPVVATLVCSILLQLEAGRPASGAEQWSRSGFTGKELLAACKAASVEPAQENGTSADSVQDFERGICRGFIEGFIAGRHVGDSIHVFHHRNEKLDSVWGRLCIPAKTDKAAVAAAFVRYLEKNSDKLNWNAGVLLETALKETYPCPEK